MLSEVQILLEKYLIQKGYTKTAAEFVQEAKQDLVVQEKKKKQEERERTPSSISIKAEVGGDTNSSQLLTPKEEESTLMAQRILSTIAEELLLTGVSEGKNETVLYRNGYEQFRNWALGSVEIVRPHYW